VRETDCRLAVILIIAPSTSPEERRKRPSSYQIFLDQCGGGVQLAEGFGAGPDWPTGSCLERKIISCMS